MLAPKTTKVKVSLEISGLQFELSAPWNIARQESDHKSPIFSQTGKQAPHPGQRLGRSPAQKIIQCSGQALEESALVRWSGPATVPLKDARQQCPVGASSKLKVRQVVLNPKDLFQTYYERPAASAVSCDQSPVNVEQYRGPLIPDESLCCRSL